MLTSETSLARAVRIQVRVVFALIMREIITRYGRHNIGFAWLFGEPLLFTAGIATLWNVLNEGGHGHDLNVTAFAVTSYSTVLLWRNTIGRCTLAVEPNAALLFHRNVRIIDLFYARIALEVIGTTFSMLVIISTCVLLGLIDPPADVLDMAAGWVLLTWYSASLGLLIGSLTEYSELVERLWHPISYFQLPVSGAFVMASWLPENLRDIMLLFPAPNCVELFRHGYFGQHVQTYYDLPYTMIVCAVLTWLALAVVRDVSIRVRR